MKSVYLEACCPPLAPSGGIRTVLRHSQSSGVIWAVSLEQPVQTVCCPWTDLVCTWGQTDCWQCRQSFTNLHGVTSRKAWFSASPVFSVSAVAQFVETLLYKPEGYEFDPRCRLWNFFFFHCLILPAAIWPCVTLTFWRRDYFFLILAHSVYVMWIIQEPNTLELWNKLHFD